MEGNSSGNSTSQGEGKLNLYYAACEVLVAIFAVVGNALVIFVFRKERRLRRRTNYYIVSLAAADLLVGLLGIPFAIMSSVGLPENLHACLFTVSLLVVLCTISIFCLVAVSVDRYWAILHPMGYSRNVRTKTALVIISICWFAGSVVGFLPLMGWHNGDTSKGCLFLKVMDLKYLAFLYFVTIITPAVLLVAFYAHIYMVVLKQLRQIVTMNPEKGSSTKGSCTGGTMIRTLGVQQTNEVKATQNLAIIVLFFMICWIPLYTINCIKAFNQNFQVDPTFMLFCIILSHLNSAGNPLLYAYHLRDFRAALKNFFCNLFDRERYCEQINRNNYNYSQYSIHLRKKSSIASSGNLTNSSKKYKAKPSPEKVKISALPATGEMQRTIWNISEHSNSSSDSLKSVESCSQDKVLMIRPATPYRPRTVSEINPAYLVATTPLYDDSDDGFNEEETLPYRDYALDDCELETCLGDRAKKPRCVPRGSKRSLSTSSPQLFRGVFFVEAGVDRENDKTVSFSLHGPRRPVSDDSGKTGNFSLSPPATVGGVFGGRRELSRSLSDGGDAAAAGCMGNGAVKSLEGCHKNS